MLLFASSCALIEPGAKFLVENVPKIWEKSKSDTVTVDSINVKFNSVYWEEVRADTLDMDETIDYNRDGYNIWIRNIGKHRQVEVKKLDTMLKFKKAN
jgi:hypothetical protein